MNNRTLSAITLGCFFIALAVGLLLYVATDKEPLIILWTTMLIFGTALFALSFLYSTTAGKFGPSEFMYRVAISTILSVLGLIGLLDTFIEIDPLILIIILLIVMAPVGMMVAMMSSKQEGQ